MITKKSNSNISRVSSYANATEVLPAELVKTIQQYHTGMLYVPSTGSYYDKRKTLILTLVEKGVSAKEISRLAGVSARRVRQIVHDARVVAMSDG